MKTYICGIFGSNQRVLVSTYKVFTDVQLVKQWIKANCHAKFKAKNMTDEEFLKEGLTSYENYHLSIHEVDAIDDLKSTSKKVNDLTQFFK